jgi:hypothetical protein
MLCKVDEISNLLSGDEKMVSKLISEEEDKCLKSRYYVDCNHMNRKKEVRTF